ncbi:GntR family transcriptional regulator [Fischerella sp.]|jgi:DNA-binding transcriptional regulator YhcF (GntR family)|uniref:GntR family transcriptional regulator n=1 Tax=Fischerella sp. TaxID=1191 RepID=UPI0025BEE467|nr:GntR family transcriptional regulator [Fischerella sp.]
MKIFLDRQSAKPLYLQIRDRISSLIKSGALQSGDRLPSIRSLAQSLQVNKLTIIEAYTAQYKKMVCAYTQAHTTTNFLCSLLHKLDCNRFQ